MLDEVDLAHPPRTQQSQNPVSGEGFTDPQRHGQMLAAAIAVNRRLHALVNHYKKWESGPAPFGSGIGAAAGAAVPPQGHHWATPPCPEQVPLWCSLCESLPSRQMAVALFVFWS